MGIPRGFGAIKGLMGLIRTGAGAVKGLIRVGGGGAMFAFWVRAIFTRSGVVHISHFCFIREIVCAGHLKILLRHFHS